MTLDLEEGQAAYVAMKLLDKRVTHEICLPGIGKPAKVNRWLSHSKTDAAEPAFVCFLGICLPEELVDLGYPVNHTYYLSVAPGRTPAEAFAVAMQEAKMVISQVIAQLEMLEAYRDP